LDKFARSGTASARDAHFRATPVLIQPMKPSLRYLCALLINVALPWLAYRLALPHWGQGGALLASALPPIAWMIWDLLRHRHFDALSALVLVGIALSLLVRLAGGDASMQLLEDPMVSGMIGLAFLASLALRRPLVFYLARSTMSRENHRSVEQFEKHWRERPMLASSIRLMTLGWGLGMVGENLLRCAIVLQWPSDPRTALASTLVRYGVYGALTLWTFWLRRRIRQDALRYPNEDATPANPPLASG
jgi:hypothetical protein